MTAEITGQTAMGVLPQPLCEPHTKLKRCITHLLDGHSIGKNRYRYRCGFRSGNRNGRALIIKTPNSASLSLSSSFSLFQNFFFLLLPPSTGHSHQQRYGKDNYPRRACSFGSEQKKREDAC